ncbi:hypothetical protein ACHWQZ_G001753 [Mnemiopsis leidyi]
MTVSREPHETQYKPKLGHYQLDKALGAGNYAVVRLAVHCITGTKVAMKIIDKSKLCKEDLARLFREVQIMKLLDHPNIIRFYQVVENYQYIHLVSSFAENGELYEHVMTKGSLSEPEARKYFAQICSAIMYCHEKGVVHRDLKIENVLLDCNNNVRIADFGFSNYFKPPRLLETFCGSPQYAAPEIFNGKHYDGFKTDIWSLGIILYVLVTGGLPFDGDSIQEVKQNVLRGKFRVPYFVSHVTSECEHLIRSMLSLEPEKRPSVESVLSHSWMQGDQLTSDESRDSQSSRGLNRNILTLMENIGISKSKVVESYNSYLFNDFTAIYKLLADQLHTKGSIDMKPIKDWLRQEVRNSGKSTSDEHPIQPVAPPPSKPSHKKVSSKQGLDKVLHNAKNRALSAIFNKNSDEPSGKSKAKLKELKGIGNSKHGPSPLVSSLISPRTVTDMPQSSNSSIFHRTVFGFSSRKATSRSTSSSQQLPHSAR